MTTLDILRSSAARITDALAAIGERMPGVAQVTISTPVASITVTPQPPAQTPAACPHCGQSKR